MEGVYERYYLSRWFRNKSLSADKGYVQAFASWPAQWSMVLSIRYIGSETAKPMPWREVAMAIYKDDSDSKMLAIYRLHGRALKNLPALTS